MTIKLKIPVEDICLTVETTPVSGYVKILKSPLGYLMTEGYAPQSHCIAEQWVAIVELEPVTVGSVVWNPPAYMWDGEKYKETVTVYSTKTKSYIYEEEAPPEEGLAKIVTVSLPAELYEGDAITGYVDVRNDGGADLIKCKLVTEWNGEAFETQETLNPLGILRAEVPSGVVMPAQNAVITMYGYHDVAGSWVLDDTATH